MNLGRLYQLLIVAVAIWSVALPSKKAATLTSVDIER
jgi:hypothetical protein